MAVRRALITGVAGQDGSYLAELLLAKGYEVHGFLRPDEGAGWLPAAAFASLAGTRGLIENYDDVVNAILRSTPDECYHLAAQTFVLGEDVATVRTNTLGTQHVLFALREHAPGCRLFLAGSSEMFGEAVASPQTEETPMRPRNVYGVSKVAAYMLMRQYRENSGLHASCGILYNHESPRRGEQFVTRKITRAAVRIKAGLQKELRLGNLDAIRDWGDARDYVEAMWLMLQQPAAGDYVIATGEGRTVKDFLDAAFQPLDLDWREFVTVDDHLYRPAEKTALIGDPAKAERCLKWSRRRGFRTTVQDMVAGENAT
jgi:GDPmannose 4,6-dehydratase